MKNSKRIYGVVCVILIVAIASLGQKSPNNAAHASAAKTISASGYVTAGVEAGCLMLQDSKTKTLYNLLFAGKKKPGLGEAIQFTGKRHEGPTACMQGEAVDVHNWTLVKTLPSDGKK